MKDMKEQLKVLASDPEFVVDGGEFWAVILQEDGSFTAAWVTGNGDVRTETGYRSRRAAARMADSVWGQ